MVVLVLVAVGDHRAAPVPPAAADDVEGLGAHGVGGADDGPDVEVVTPVLHGDVEVVPPGVEVGDDRVVAPVAVCVDDVAAVTVRQQLGVPVVTDGRRPLPRTDPDGGAHLVGSARPTPFGRCHGFPFEQVWVSRRMPGRLTTGDRSISSSGRRQGGFRLSRAHRIPCDACTHSPPSRPSPRPSVPSGWTPPTCWTSTAVPSSGSPWSSSSSSAG